MFNYLQWLHTYMYFNYLCFPGYRLCSVVSCQCIHIYFNCLCFPGYQWCSVVSCIRTTVTPTNLPQTVSSGYKPTSAIFVFQANSGVQLSAASGQWLDLQTCYRLPPVATQLLQLSLFSRLPVVFSCNLYQDNGYTYKPATDCLQWLHTYFSYVCFPGYQLCSVVSCIRTVVTQSLTPTNLPQTVSSSYTPTSTIFFFQATSGVQLSAACHRLYPVKTHLLQLSLFSRLPVVFSCQLPATDCIQGKHTYFSCPCFPGYQWCSVVSCIRTVVTPTNLPQTVSSGYTHTLTIFVFHATSGVQLSVVSGQWLHLRTCHRLSPVATQLHQLSLFSRKPVVFSCHLPATDFLQWLHTYFNCLCFPGYQ